MTGQPDRPWMTVNEARARANYPPIEGGELKIPLAIPWSRWIGYCFKEAWGRVVEAKEQSR